MRLGVVPVTGEVPGLSRQFWIHTNHHAVFEAIRLLRDNKARPQARGQRWLRSAHDARVPKSQLVDLFWQARYHLAVPSSPAWGRAEAIQLSCGRRKRGQWIFLLTAQGADSTW